MILTIILYLAITVNVAAFIQNLWLRRRWREERLREADVMEAASKTLGNMALDGDPDEAMLMWIAVGLGHQASVARIKAANGKELKAIMHDLQTQIDEAQRGA